MRNSRWGIEVKLRQGSIDRADGGNSIRQSRPLIDSQNDRICRSIGVVAYSPTRAEGVML
ncbi:MAG: hypothetical protein D6680_02875 [Cyanobacteria bacterium J007]|nr:MAG: hypothetical protein D6680_02875 [Cyanobacteria bacterium J007]